ncbi:nucleotidyltransferase family protein [Pseudomonas syringae]|uniref:nucleotidyltransferase family protein n=1 Tax=Pseudomonas syringae TaxID=317 RepID=UPI003B00E2EF
MAPPDGPQFKAWRCLRNPGRFNEPYLSTTDAMRYWPETATAIAIRLGESGSCEIAAPLGLDDLFGLVIRPAAGFGGNCKLKRLGGRR